MITTIKLKQGITQEKYDSIVEMLKKIGVLVKEEKDDTKMSKEDFFAKIDRARNSTERRRISVADFKEKYL